MAVVGLPDPRKDHAVVMARFAKDCLLRFNVVTKQLENTLGPDTSDLGMRFGLHSGPVTAGVLRGDRARFQLFGDTMNTAARIESTGMRNKIHISCETAERLEMQGKSHWCIPRSDRVVAKGKGELTTYWLELKGESARSSHSGASSESCEEGADSKTAPESVSQDGIPKKQQGPAILSEKHQRLVNWNTEILCRILREAVARRETVGTKADHDEVRRLEAEQRRSQRIGLDEVKDVVCLPTFNPVSNDRQVDPEKVEVTSAVTQQLQDYVATIANLYRDNAFHNFEHASHVTMSVIKLLSRIVAPDIKSNDAKELHDHTYGITSDPLTQFAVILSALVHDVDHTGVPNTQLIKEQAGIASVYKNKSVAEQNSIDIAWDLLQQDQFEDLRRVIYVNADEFQRFRQLLVNVVMATDIMDKDLSSARKARWNQAFAEASLTSDDMDSVTNRKATIVMEHLIQASDVAHTMQHWHIYRKWNSRLFEEMYRAFLDGRADKDPSETWYEGEIAFFDFYIIPLAKKLKDCGVFGVSSDEYHCYAQQNRREWESKGRQIVAEMVDRFKSD